MIILKPGIYRYDIYCKDGKCHIYNEDKTEVLYESDDSLDITNVFVVNGAISKGFSSFTYEVVYDIIKLTFVDMNAYIRVEKRSNVTYAVSTQDVELTGFFKILNANSNEIRLGSWFDKKTKRYKTDKNKQWDHLQNWFSVQIWDALRGDMQ